MKGNAVLKVIIVILLIAMAGMIGWYFGKQDGNGTVKTNDQTTTSNNQTTDDIKKDDTISEDLSIYPEWMQYILKSDIKSISIYKWIDKNDVNYKSDKNSLYKVELTRDNLKDIFNSMKEGKMKVVAGLGGTADYLRISYISDNKTYNLDFRQNYIDNNDNDVMLKQLLTKENTDIVNSMTEEMKEIFGSNPTPNYIEWNYSVLDNYYNSSNATTYYYDM